ncbi:MAG TPA: hypothetical protein VFM19_08870, partial [Candidatus Limnocylindria bacterium]|nr:hypothetical protein [Candidatus Limnocylindria bacterium]
MTDLRLARGEAVTPERAGWRYLSFFTRRIERPVQVGEPGHETALVVLAGGGLTVDGAELP